MWQLAVAAALAGSSFFATRLFNNDPDNKETQKRSHLLSNQPEFEFEFSSPEAEVNKKGKTRNGFAGKWKKGDGKKKSGNGFGVCVKKRRVSKFGPGKCDSCSSKGNSSFSRGIGVGIMCMISAGKAEISKLNAAVDETAKVVHELKFEISKRKTSHHRQVLSSKLDNNTALEEHRGKDGSLLPQSSLEFKYNVQNYSTCVSEESECERSILSEEPQGEVMEMDLLEAELEFELQKLSWSPSNASVPEERRLDSYENDASAEGIYEQNDELSSLVLSNGVTPSVLNQKLCNVLIKQQEGQIMELETELHQAQFKLHEREAELQALKDCVRRMSQCSITNASDEETKKQVAEKKGNDFCSKIGSEPDRPTIGMKRAMSFGSYSCHVTSESN